MAAVVARRVRTSQPQQNVQIDWSNPITAGLVFAYTMGNEAQGWGEDGQNGIPYVKASDGTPFGRRINTLSGTGGQLLSTSSSYLFNSPTQTSIKSGAYSLFAFGTGPASGMQSALDDDDGTTRRFQFRLNAGKVELIPFYSGGNGDVIAPAALSAYDLASGFAMGATVNGTAAAVYQKGAKTAATLGGAAQTPNASITVGARKTGSQTWTSGGLMLVAMWNRPLTDAEHASLADNPWQLFKAQPVRRLWLAWSASAGVNLIPDPATFALTGYAPTLDQTANVNLSPSPATFSLTGYAPVIDQTANVNLSPAPAAFSLTGYAPAIDQSNGIVLSPAPASFALTGYAPTIAQTNNTDLSPAPASFALTGYAPTVDQATGKNLIPGAASFALTGYVPTVTQAQMPADPRYARPIGDISAGPWIASDGGYLSNAIAQDDSITMSANAPGVCEIKLAPVVDPMTSSGQVVRYQASSSSGGGLTVRLKQGASVIAQWTLGSLSSTPTVYTQSLSAAQCDSITNYADLRFEFEAL